MLVDCVRVSEFDHDFVCVFACLDVKKMQEKIRKSWIFYFLGNHVLGGRTWRTIIIYLNDN